MSVKKMIDLYVQYGVDVETWKMLYSMTCHGLISRENWVKFAKACHGWYMLGDNILNEYDEVIYTADKDGYWKKVS